MTRFVQERFQLTLAAIVVANDAATEWEHRAIALRPGLTLPPRKRWPVSSGIVGRAIRTGEPQLVLDVAKGRFEATDIPPPGAGDHGTPNAFQLQ